MLTAKGFELSPRRTARAVRHSRPAGQAVQPARAVRRESKRCWPAKTASSPCRLSAEPTRNRWSTTAMKLPTEVFGDVVVVHTPEELGADTAGAVRDVSRPRSSGATSSSIWTAPRRSTAAAWRRCSNAQEALRALQRRPEDRHQQRRQPQDPGNHPARPAAGSVRSVIDAVKSFA